MISTASMKPRVLVTRHVYPAAIAILQEDCIADYQDTYDVMDEAALSKRLRLARGVISQLTDPLSPAVIVPFGQEGYRAIVMPMRL